MKKFIISATVISAVVAAAVVIASNVCIITEDNDLFDVE